MGGSYDSYKAAMKDPWKGWWVAWPPIQRVRLGDVFDTSGGTLRTAGDLAAHGIGFDAVPGASAASFTYDSQGSISIRFKLAGSVPQGFSVLAETDAARWSSLPVPRPSSPFTTASPRKVSPIPVR